MSAENDASTFRSKDFFRKFRDEVEEILQGEHIWEEKSDGMKKFLIYAKEHWLTIPSNTQLVERWVKDANECTFNTKDEALSNALAILHSTTIFRFRRLALEELAQRELKANQHHTKGIAGQRVDKLTGEVETSRKIEKVRGASYMRIVIQECKKELATLTSLATPSHVHKEIQTILSSSKNTFKSQKTTEAVNAYQ